MDDGFATIETAQEICVAEHPLDVVVIAPGTAGDIFVTLPECDGVSSESEPFATLVKIGNEILFGTVVFWMTAVVLFCVELACVVKLDEEHKVEKGLHSFGVALIVVGAANGETNLELWTAVEIFVLAGKETKLDSSETGHG